MSLEMTYVFLIIFFKGDRHFSIDTPYNKYILLQHGNIFENYVFAEGKNTLKGLKNNT